MIITTIGFAAGTITTIGFFPQIIKALKTKNTTDISLWMPIVLCTGIFLWLVYGLLINDWPLIIANAIAFAANLFLVLLKLKYSKK